MLLVYILTVFTKLKVDVVQLPMSVNYFITGFFLDIGNKK